jgi:YVTN family beta-propeller protein
MRELLFVAAVAAATFPPTPSYCKDTGLIFVSNEKSNNLIILDPKTYKVVKDLKVSRRPRDMHFNSDHSKLYVACGDDDVIDIVDVATLEVIGRLATGSSPEIFALDEKRRRIYVSNEEGSSLSVIDIDQNIIVHEVPTGAEPEGVLISEDGKTVYVTSEVSDLVHMVDPDGGHVTADVVVGTRPRRVAATPDGKELWVTAELSGDVYIIDRANFTVSDKIQFLPPGMRKTDVTPVGLVMTKDGKTAFVTLGHAAHVAAVDVATRKCSGGRCSDAQSSIVYPRRQAIVGHHFVTRRKPVICRQRLWRRHHHHRCKKPQGNHFRPGRPHSLGGGYRRLKPSNAQPFTLGDRPRCDSSADFFCLWP